MGGGVGDGPGVGVGVGFPALAKEVPLRDISKMRMIAETIILGMMTCLGFMLTMVLEVIDH
jgi:hypothetical protein